MNTETNATVAYFSQPPGEGTVCPDAPEIPKGLERLELPDELEAARANLESGLRTLITKAKAGDVGASKKLRIFGSVSDPALATRLALMSHDQRRAYLAHARAERGRKAARKKGGAKKRSARK